MAVVIINIFISGLILQNVDANAAKDLMAHLVDLQSNLDDVNKYSFPPIQNSPFCLYCETNF